MSNESAISLLSFAVLLLVIGSLLRSCDPVPVVEDAALQSAWNCMDGTANQNIRCA